jgi:ubiquinone/menaquinone biosynthesis C-methylase UbiE
MSCFTDGHGLSPSFLIKGYPWSSIGNGTGTIVDVGGSKGTVMAEIAKSVPGLKFIIQDLPDMIQGAKEEIPSDVTERVDFMVHDFFKEQTVQADAYFFRYIFHNWSDRNSIKILKALVPALKPGARVIINDHVLPEPGTSSYIKERAVR